MDANCVWNNVSERQIVIVEYYIYNDHLLLFF